MRMPARLGLMQRLGAIRRGNHIVPTGGEVDPQCAKDLWFVINNQNATHAGASSDASAGPDASRRG